MSGNGDEFDGDDDAALRYAIALSLGQVGPQATADDPIQLSSDDDHEEGDMDRPELYRHRQPAGAPDASTPNLHDRDAKITMQACVSTSTAPMPAAQPPPVGLAVLDRRAMEAERLARHAKRKAPDSPQEGQNRQRVKTCPTGSPIPGTAQGAAASGLSTGSWLGEGAVHGRAGLRFPQGAVKRTWAAGFSRTGDDIKIDEVLQKADLELAVVSSYQWDDEWMLSKIDVSRTKLLCIAFASDEQHRREISANAPNVNVRFCFPDTPVAGSMHSKLQLLKFPSFLRIVVPSGNLVPYDWGETGAMENIVFLIDLPKISDTPEANNPLSPFGHDLCYFLRAQGVKESLVESLGKYDFTETNRYAFVHTIAGSHGGSHVDDSWKRTGYCGLGRAVTALGLGTQGTIDVDMVVSSLGAVNNDLVLALYYAAQGDDGTRVYRERTTKSKGGRAGSSATITPLAFEESFQIYFPSHQTVTESRGGTEVGKFNRMMGTVPLDGMLKELTRHNQSAGTIFTQAKWWNAESFPRRLIRDCVSRRTGLLMHNKMMFVRQRETARAWAYVGSANLSESAWGRLTMNNRTNPKLTCRNWECGVLCQIPASSGADSARNDAANQSSRIDMSVFLGSIPVPMVVPGAAYGTTSQSSSSSSSSSPPPSQASSRPQPRRPWLCHEN